MKSTPIYRAVMQAIEARRLELGIAMATVDDLAGTQDGYYAKILYPDTPSGKCAGWPTIELVVQALFGRDYGVHFTADAAGMPSTLGMDKGASHKYLKIRHWRHRHHFETMGAKGGEKRIANLKANGNLSQAQRKAAKARWRKAKRAKRQGQKHREANAAKSPRVREPSANPLPVAPRAHSDNLCPNGR